jgi:hypothetical protein
MVEHLHKVLWPIKRRQKREGGREGSKERKKEGKGRGREGGRERGNAGGSEGRREIPVGNLLLVEVHSTPHFSFFPLHTLRSSQKCISRLHFPDLSYLTLAIFVNLLD